MNLSEIMKMKDKDGKPCPPSLFQKLTILSEMRYLYGDLFIKNTTAHIIDGDKLSFKWEGLEADIINLANEFGIKFMEDMGTDSSERFNLMDFE